MLALRLVVLFAATRGLAAERKTAAFAPADAAPYFASGAAERAAADLRLEEWTRAAQEFAAYLKASPRAKDAHQATFLLGYAELKAGRFNDASNHFDELVKAYPLLADYHRVFGARAHLLAGRAQDALDRAKRVPSESALDGDARFIRAEAARTLGQDALAATEYGAYLERYPQSWRAAEARFRLASALEATGDGGAAKAQFRALYLEAPQQSWGQKAAAHLDAGDKFSPDEIMKRAMALFDAMRNADSEAEWRRVLGLGGLDDAQICSASYYVAQSVFKARQRSRAASLFAAAAEACARAKDEDLTVKSLYQGARCLGSASDVATLERAIALYERVWREHPEHSYADDARIHEAEVCDGIKDDAKATELYAGLPSAFPNGDQRGEALWRLAFRAWKKNDLDGAQKYLATELALLPREDGWWEAGRTLYWLGRVADRKGDGAAAQDLYAKSARQYPLSYYSLSALNRLREKWPDEADALAAELGKPIADDAWHFAPRPLFKEPAFRRGVELARLGLGAEAKRELALAGIEVPKGRKSIPAGDEREELLWLAAVLYDRAGEFSISHSIPRYLLTGYEASWPVGDNHKRWLLSYPRGYRELIEKHAALNGQPAALELAIVREESGFDPNMESFANAVGLTQLTPPPAARFANGLPHDSKALRDPAINVAIGARELGHSWGTYRGLAPLVIAAYNAGEGAVNRWLKDPDRSGRMLDELIESIPYDETRGYTKRVLASYFAYSWLYDGHKVPSLPLKRN